MVFTVEDVKRAIVQGSATELELEFMLYPIFPVYYGQVLDFAIRRRNFKAVRVTWKVGKFTNQCAVLFRDAVTEAMKTFDKEILDCVCELLPPQVFTELVQTCNRPILLFDSQLTLYLFQRGVIPIGKVLDLVIHFDEWNDDLQAFVDACPTPEDRNLLLFYLLGVAGSESFVEHVLSIGVDGNAARAHPKWCHAHDPVYYQFIWGRKRPLSIQIGERFNWFADIPHSHEEIAQQLILYGYFNDQPEIAAQLKLEENFAITFLGNTLNEDTIGYVLGYIHDPNKLVFGSHPVNYCSEFSIGRFVKRFSRKINWDAVFDDRLYWTTHAEHLSSQDNLIHYKKAIIYGFPPTHIFHPVMLSYYHKYKQHVYLQWIAEKARIPKEVIWWIEAYLDNEIFGGKIRERPNNRRDHPGVYIG